MSRSDVNRTEAGPQYARRTTDGLSEGAFRMIDRRKLGSASLALWTAGILGGVAVGGLLGRSLRLDALPSQGAIAGFDSDRPLADDEWPVSAMNDRPGELPAVAGDAGTLASLTQDPSIIRTADVSVDATRVTGEPVMLPNGVPRSIDDVDDATPLAAANSREADPLLDAILNSELPNATEAELDVWRDVLAGMPVNDAREIIRMRKQLSRGPVVGPGLFPVLRDRKPTKPVQPAPSPFDETFAAFDAAARVHQHNIANVGALGFLPGRPLLSEAVDHIGSDFAGEQILSTQWKPMDTFGRHDVAPAKGHFFGVDAGDEVLFTVLGKIAVEDKRLGITFSDRWLPLVPEVVIGEGETVASLLDEIVQWSLDSPLDLERAGAGRFRAGPAAGEAHKTDAELTTGVLAVGDVDVAEEEQQLQLLEIRRQLIQTSGRRPATLLR